MNLFFDIDSSAQYSVEEKLNESTGKTEKKYKIKGIFSTIGEKNRNGRIYPLTEWEREVNNFQDNFAKGSYNLLMEWQHPARTEVDPMKAVAKLESLKIQGNYVLGEAVLLDNTEANQLKSLIDNGIKIAVSSRGLGNVNNGLVSDFKLICYDIVPDPSDYNATMNGVVESYQLNEGVVKDLNFAIDRNGNIKAKVNEVKHEIFSMKQIQEAFETKIKDYFRVLLGESDDVSIFKEKQKEILKDKIFTEINDAKDEVSKLFALENGQSHIIFEVQKNMKSLYIKYLNLFDVNFDDILVMNSQDFYLELCSKTDSDQICELNHDIVLSIYTYNDLDLLRTAFENGDLTKEKVLEDINIINKAINYK